MTNPTQNRTQRFHNMLQKKMRLPLQLQITWKCTVNWSVKFICAAAIHPSIKITYQSRNRQGESNTVMWCAWWDEMPFYNNNTHAYKWINPNNSISMVGLNEKESFLCNMFYCVSKIRYTRVHNEQYKMDSSSLQLKTMLNEISIQIQN